MGRDLVPIPVIILPRLSSPKLISIHGGRRQLYFGELLSWEANEL